MLFTRNKNRVQLPRILNSHQVKNASQLIHDKSVDVVTPHLDTKPHYHAIKLILEKVDLAIGQLDEAHDQRPFESATNLRATGGLDGKFDYDTASQLKKQFYRARRSQMKRLRTMIEWQHNPAVINPVAGAIEDPKQIAGKRLAEILRNRLKDFESKSYGESMTEGDRFIKAIEQDSESLAAIDLIGVRKVYEQFKSLHAQFKAVHLEQTSRDARREEKPKVVLAASELRHAMAKLLGLIHFDVENGDPTFFELLGDVDEILDKEHATAARRITLAKKEAAKKEADKKEAQKQAANQQAATDASGTSDANAEADGEPPADGGTGGTSVAASGVTSGNTSGGADQGSDADTDQTPVDADPVADANSDQQQVSGEVETA